MEKYIDPDLIDRTYQYPPEALKALAKAVALEYNLREILDADFLSVSSDPQFLAAITRKTN